MAQDNKLIRSLIESSRNGNYNAFEQLFKMHAGYIYAISFRLLGNIEDANENISKIFTEAWKTISMVRRDSPFILWLKAIAIYSSLQSIREKDKNEIAGNRKMPDRRGLSFLDQEIISLPESERIVFVLNDIEHYKKEEISDLLSMAEEEIENILVNARKIIMKASFIGSNEALEIAVKQIPEYIEPDENLYKKISDEISRECFPDQKERPEQLTDMDDKSSDRKPKHGEKRFSFKDFFKKKE